MKRLYFLFMLPLAVAYASAQSQPTHVPIYNTWVYDLSGKLSIKGILYSANDSSITVINSTSREDIIAGKISRVELPVEQIKTIKLRYRGQIGIEMAAGFITGFATGFATTEESEDMTFKDWAGESVALGLILAPITAIGGAIIGSGREKIEIDGNMVTYWALKENISRYAFNKQLVAPEAPIAAK